MGLAILGGLAALDGKGLFGGGGNKPPPPPPGATTPTSGTDHSKAAASAAADHALGAGDLAGKTQAATAAQSSSYRDTGTEMGMGG
jgi:hypothetical protein